MTMADLDTRDFAVALAALTKLLQTSTCGRVDSLIDHYHRVLEAHVVSFPAIREPADWHLTLFTLSDPTPEVIFDVDRREDRVLFYRTRFGASVWRSLIAARQQSGDIQQFSVERACSQLPATHRLVALLESDAVFRLNEPEGLGLDGVTHVVVHSFFGGGRRLSAWNATREPAWAGLLDAVRHAEMTLPTRG